MIRASRWISGFLIILIVHSSALLPAQVVPGRWQKVDLLAAGTEIILTTSYGEVLDCFYFSSTREILLVVEAATREQRRIPKSSVKQIIAKGYDDRLRNGALVGLIAGAAGGALLTTATNTARHKNSKTDRVLGSLLFGLLGMGLGVLIDYRHKGQEVIYEAPAASRH